MIPDDYADYTECSLAELYDLARQIDSLQFPNRYVRVLVEIEKHGGKLPKVRSVEPRKVKRPKKPVRPWRDWLFEEGATLRTSSDIATWWEARLRFWWSFVSVLLFSAIFTAWFFSLLAGLRTRSQLFWSLLMAFPFVVLLSLLAWAFVALMSCLVFVFVGLLDVALHKPLAFLGWRLSIVLFAALLVLAIVIAATPFVSFFLTMLRR